MDLNEITSIIGTVGFPIAMCLLLWKTHREEMTKMSEAIDNNTLVIQRLVDLLDKKE